MYFTSNMKLKDIFTANKNKRNNQVVCTLKIKQAKKYGLTPEQIMNLNLAHLRVPKDKRSIRFK